MFIHRVKLVSFIVLLFAAISHAGELQFDPKTVAGKEGFYRVGKTTDGQWWFIGPEGKPFYFKGCTSINRAGTIGGRRAVPGPYATVVDAKYGWLQNKQPFVDAQLKRLRDWGFNALGAWTTVEFFGQAMPYTEIIEFWKVGPYLDYEFPADAEVYGGKKFRVPDVFDSQWVADCDAKAKQLCTPRRDSRQLVGYFTDNEINFGDRGYVLLDICRKGNPNMPVTKAARAFTGTRQEWVRVFAGRYFQTAHDLIRKHDPNHLILGCRFGGPPGPEVFAAITPWTAVVSANNYRIGFYEKMDEYYRATGKPILNGEFNWWSDLFRGRTQFQKGEASLRKVFTHPGVVGYTWYR